MSGLDTAAMVQRFQQRADAVRNRTMPPSAGAECKAFVEQAELDYQDLLLLADSKICLAGCILPVDLLPAICDVALICRGASDTHTMAGVDSRGSAGRL